MRLKSFLIILILFNFSATSFAAVSLILNGTQAVIKNDYVTLNFTSYAKMNKLHVGDTNIAADEGVQSFYLDYVKGTYGQFWPNSIHIVENTTSRVHFYWLQDNVDTVFKMELHYIMTDDLSGIYSYVKYINDKDHNITFGETRLVYRFNPKILTQGTNQERYGTVPNGEDLKTCSFVQDSTWKFPNGTYYSKYDYACYIRNNNYEGVYGNGYGGFVISSSKEYHGGGPLKQDLTVHQECLVANYLASGHFGNTGINNAPPGWVHIYGPFLLYFPTGQNDDDIMSSVINQVEVEKANWPYSWMNDTEYPLERAQVSGSLSGQKSATVVLWDSLDEDFDRNSHGYLYHANTDSNGNYVIKNVRPGTYRMAAYPTAGLGSDSLDETYITVAANDNAKVNFTLNEPTNIIWSIGEANRLSSEFKYSNESRNYEWKSKTPKYLNFTIGISDPKEDWYYAQSILGHWYIKYQDTQDGNNRTLRVALAAATKSHLQILVNGHRIGDTYYDNDSSVYRSAMQSGRYHSNVVTFPNSRVVNGENTIEFWISLGQVMYDTISLQRGLG